MDADELRKLIEEAWQLSKRIADLYQDEWCKAEHDVPYMTRLAAAYRRADDRYWRRVDAEMDRFYN